MFILIPRPTFIAVLFTALISSTAAAHFQELIPSNEIISTPNERALQFTLDFTHPMARGPAMPMAKPKHFGVLIGNRKVDLMAQLTPVQLNNQPAFTAQYTIKQPGDHLFFVEPAPYWEQAEGVMIIHYTKVIVSAYGEESGWDQPIGLPVEIIPLTRPYGLWTGHLMRGVVQYNGQPAPFATVEVEWRNDGSITAPADPFITQVIKTDANGVFAFTMPRAGWWGFAALIPVEQSLPNPDGTLVPVELGGLLWVRTRDL
ncbi:DUF4198 domain-containing protein [Rhodoferax sp. 4810]|uniref:DUF4198 domain-containing protein n=1 Tax=Thiospirillum jenense TaxID=1653858 RepID=A0A839H3K3_9GAMM|nr:DUF4198 domain-containing protein [Thiospirillum jenense]MBB1076290.1 DUF4198 domain-containing protein [Rhodoferax jenense]MBB1124883.1 DUF4198 domain-containing protein [Thiospirillum jenense]